MGLAVKRACYNITLTKHPHICFGDKLPLIYFGACFAVLRGLTSSDVGKGRGGIPGAALGLRGGLQCGLAET